MSRPQLNGLSEIYTFFRKNTTPIYFVSPTSYNLLGLDQWVSTFEFINYFDSFDGYHPRVFIPTLSGPPEFRSMEDVNNYLLGHKEVVDLVRQRGGKGKALFVMFDEETEELAADLGLDVVLPPAALRKRLDSKIETTRLGNEAGVASVPNWLGKVTGYDQLMRTAKESGLSDRVVIQTAFGDSGHIVNKIPRDVDVGSVRYQTDGNRLVISDGGSFSLPINEFGPNR